MTPQADSPVLLAQPLTDSPYCHIGWYDSRHRVGIRCSWQPLTGSPYYRGGGVDVTASIRVGITSIDPSRVP